MTVPVQITFRDVERSDALEQWIRKKVDHLVRLDDRITHCHVVLSEPHRHGKKGGLYRVRIDIAAPGAPVEIEHEGPLDHAHEDPYVTVRDAFEAAEKKLRKHVDRQNAEVKAHEEMPTGRIRRLFPREGYGYLESPEGFDVYFHRNSVVEGFDRAEVGQTVRFVLADGEGEKGPQASTVHLVHHG